MIGVPVFPTFSVHEPELVSLFLVPDPARASAHARHVLVFVVSRFSVGNDLDKHFRQSLHIPGQHSSLINKSFPFRSGNPHQLQCTYMHTHELLQNLHAHAPLKLWIHITMPLTIICNNLCNLAWVRHARCGNSHQI